VAVYIEGERPECRKRVLMDRRSIVMYVKGAMSRWRNQRKAVAVYIGSIH